MIHATAAKIWPAQSIIDRVLSRNGANVLRAIEENSIPGKKGLRLVKAGHHLVAKLSALLQPTFRQVTRQTPNSRVGSGEPSSSESFNEVINLFAFGESMQEHRDCAQIESQSPDAQEMSGDSGQFATDDTNILAARR